jgi:hypothetical protein
MVLSRIIKKNNEFVNYRESSEIEPEENGYRTVKYAEKLLGEKEYEVAIGKMRTKYIDNGGVYFPLYIISKKGRIKAKVGVYEAESSKSISLVDENGEVDVDELGDPLLFSFVTEEYLERNGKEYFEKEEVEKEEEREEGTKEEKEKEEDDANDEEEKEEDDANDEEEKEEEESDDEDIFKVKSKTKMLKDQIESMEEETEKEEKEIERVTYENLFTKDNPLPTLDSWGAETEDQAKEMRNEFKNNKKENELWLRKMMKNKNYNIQNISGDGNCMFSLIKQAYSQMGYQTSVDRLRKMLSQEVTDKQFETYKEIFNGLKFDNESYEEELSKLKEGNKSLKEQSKKTKNVEHQKEILDEAVKVKQDYIIKNTRKEETNELIGEFGFMEKIKDLEDLKGYINTSEYWADEWAISTLELLLSVKIIILEKTDDKYSMVRCGQKIYQDEKYVNYEPSYYIIAGYNGNNHYDLVTYKNKKIFKFGEIPYDLKVLIINRCIEHNNERGIYNMITEFKQLQREMNVDVEEKENEEGKGELYDPSIELSFHANSDKTKKPGKVDADKVPQKRIADFSMLSSKHELWRRKLDDSWMEAQFTTSDGKRWNSIKHYLMALPFKESNPSVYNEFSDNSKSVISKNLNKAKESIEKKSGKFFELNKKVPSLEKEVEERYRKDALRLKFQNNYKQLLKDTLRAKLMNRVGVKYVPDILLMEIRDEIFNQKEIDSLKM